MEPMTVIPSSTREFRSVCRAQSDATATAHIAVAPASANVWLSAMRACMVAEGVPAAEINRVIMRATTATQILHTLLSRLPDAWQEMNGAVAAIDHATTRARDNATGNRFQVDA